MKLVTFFKIKLLQRGYKKSEIDDLRQIYKETISLIVDQKGNRDKKLVLVTKYNPAVKQLKRAIIKHWGLIL